MAEFKLSASLQGHEDDVCHGLNRVSVPLTLL